MLKITILIEPTASADTSSAKPLVEQLCDALPLLLSASKDLLQTGAHQPAAAVPSAPLYTPPPPAARAFDAEPDHPFHPDQSVAGPGPAPATVETNLHASQELSRQQKLTQGYEAFIALLHEWQNNFGLANLPQPDRAEALRRLCDAPVYGRTLGWLQQMGGLRAGIRAVTEPRYVPAPLVDKLAENIAQVASALQYTDLSNMLEPAPRTPIISET